MMQNLYNEMTEILRKQAPAFFANEKLNKNKVTDAAYSYDGSLLKVLLNNTSLKYSQKLTILVLYFTNNYKNETVYTPINIIDTLNIMINGFLFQNTLMLLNMIFMQNLICIV